MQEVEYELRRGDEVVATGRLTVDEPVEVGVRLSIGSQQGIVRSVVPALGTQLARVVVQLLPGERA